MNILEKYSSEISVTSFWVTFLFLGPFLIATNNLSVLITGVINWFIAFLVSLVVSYIVIKVSKNTKKEKYIAIFFSVALMVAWLANTELSTTILYEKNSVLDKILRVSLVLFSALLITLVLNKKKFVVGFLPILLTTMQIVGVATNFYNAPSRIAAEKNRIIYDKSQWEVFAKDENIVVFIVDTFGSQFTAEAIENDEIRSTLKDFTYYADYISPANRTKNALPLFFNGKYREWFNLKMPNDSVINLLKDHGFGIDVLTFCSEDFFGDFPDNSKYMKNNEENINNNFLGSYLQYFQKFTIGRLREELNMYQSINIALADNYLFDLKISKSTSENKALKIIHFWGIHLPLVLDENGEELSLFKRVMQPNLETKRTNTIFKKIGLFLDQLKENDIYQKTTVIIIGDHGTFTSSLDTKERIFPKTKIDFEKFNSLMKRANATLLIKPPDTNNEDLMISYDQVSGFDIAKTMANIAKIKNNFLGHDILKSQEITADRVRYFYHYKLNNNLPEKKYFISGSVGDASGWKLEEEF